MRRTARRALAALACAVAWPASGAVLYKSVSPAGVVEFSDLPPDKSRAAQQIQIGEGSAVPVPFATQAPIDEQKLREMDAAVQRASAQVDLAERAFAVARRPVWSEPSPTRLMAPRMTRADVERIEFYRRSVVVARQQLLEMLQQKRRGAAERDQLAASSPGMPIYGPPVARR